MMLRVAVFLALLLPVSAAAQSGVVITGMVADSSGVALQDVNIFLSGTMVGTTSAEDGSYTLANVPLGASRLVVSSVGYRAQTHDILIRRPGRYGQDFRLEEQIVEVGEILVMAERDEQWSRRLRRFNQLFIGRSESAEDTHILNPEILSFDEIDGWLVASAMEPLRIENRALGYLIEHDLYAFSSKGNETRQEGEAFFQPLEPTNEREERRWDQAREIAYRGSPQHFLRAAVQDRLAEEGFYVYRASDPEPYDGNVEDILGGPAGSGFAVGPKFFVRESDEPGEYILSFPAYLEVVYTEEKETRDYRTWQGMPQKMDLEFQRSWIKLDRDFVIIDASGNVLDPRGLIYFGFMAFERVSDTVPREYGLRR